MSSAEAAAGDVEYRCIYVLNNHGSLTLQNAKLWIQANTPSSATAVDVGLGASAVNGTETAIANENTAPAGVTFDNAVDEADALVIGDLGPGQHKAIWIRRTVAAGAGAASDGFTLRVKGDTLP